MKKGKNNNPKKLNIILLISTMVAAILTGFAVEFFYCSLASRQLNSRVFMPTALGVLFAVFLSVIVLVVYFISKILLTYRADVITGRQSKGRIYLYLLTGVVAISLLMFGAEYLYENSFNFDHQMIAAADTYVFLIDDSTSMLTNDPSRERYEAIEDILSDKPDSTQFTVYSFADTTRQIIPMQTIGDGFSTRPVSDEIMTEMKAGLEKVVDDCENGIWTATGDVMLVMITDGAPSDFNTFYEICPVLDRCIDQNITLSIVGIIGADNSLMNQMASYTGGSFIDISDSNFVSDAVLSVAGNSGRTRDLVSLRNHADLDWLYALIRIISIALAGTIIAFAAALAYGNNTSFNSIVGANTVKAIVAGLILEYGNQAMIEGCAVRLFTLILLGTIISRNGSPENTVKGSHMEPGRFDDISELST